MRIELRQMIGMNEADPSSLKVMVPLLIPSSKSFSTI
jgi:hypothetical protein